MDLNVEKMIQEILTGVATAFDELDLPKKPYGRNELWEGITDYFKIKQSFIIMRKNILVLLLPLKTLSSFLTIL